jgi:hypothetical protein
MLFVPFPPVLFALCKRVFRSWPVSARLLAGAVFLLALATPAQAQVGYVYLEVRDDDSLVARTAQVTLQSLGTDSSTNVQRTGVDAYGSALLAAQPGRYRLRVQQQGLQAFQQEVTLSLNDTLQLGIQLRYASTTVVTISAGNPTARQRIENPFMETASITPEQMRNMVGVLSAEQLVSQLAGGTTSEFSSQYRIRGGNFDENLVYVNGVEIYRPQLIRAGWQEGLPISNPAMISEVQYSAGGFQARFGDKLSSVLDLKYRTPQRFGGSVELGLLTQNLHLEGARPDSTVVRNGQEYQRAGLSYLVGARRLSWAQVFRSLETQGEYQPLSADGQVVLTYTPRRKRWAIRDSGERALNPNSLSIQYLGLVNYNSFRFFPQSRETTFGTIQRAFRLFVAYIGEEQTRYLTNQHALRITQRRGNVATLHYTLNYYQSQEDELFDVEGGYRLGDVVTSLGSENFGEIAFFRGVGTELRRARNYLDMQVLYGAVDATLHLDKGVRNLDIDQYVKHTLHLGARAQQEWVADELKEWLATDSADYVQLQELIQTTNSLVTQRAQGYAQYSWRPLRELAIATGVRANYWTLNQELLISPRLQMVWDLGERPDSTAKPLQLRFATGLYQQPPFYRELRDLDGTLNRNVVAQKSIHGIVGTDWTFQMWNRPFKLTAEAWYRHLTDLVPFEYQNVRLRYYANQQATGYAYGVDVKINGQFLRDLDSYFRVSYLDTRERIVNQAAVQNQGTVARPTDQRLVFSFFFQDHLPQTRRLKVHVNFIYGTGIPYGPPTDLRLRTVFRMPSYQRVDLGLSYLLLYRVDEERLRRVSIRSVQAALEVFNLFQRQNTVSHNWIEDFYGQRFAVPNYLSQRLLNARVIVRF